MVYKFKEGSHINLDAKRVHQELTQIGKTITAEGVVKFAENSKTELHKHFEWNDTEAAHKFRLTQARTLISCIVYCAEDSEEETKCYENVNIAEERVYAPISMILKDEDLFDQIYDDTKRAIINLDNKLTIYSRQFKKLNPVKKEMAKVRQRIESMA